MTREGALLLALLLLPVASGSTASGVFTLEGQARLPHGTELAFRPVLAFHNDTATFQTLVLRSPRVEVHEAFSQKLAVGLGEHAVLVPVKGDSNETTYQDVEIRLAAGSRDGALALYPSPDAETTLWAADPVFVEASDRTEAASIFPGEEGKSGPFANGGYYSEVVERPHLRIQGSGHLLYEGEGVLKVMGPDLELRSSNGMRTIPTGWETSSDTPGVRTQRWAVIFFDPGTLQVETASDWLMAAPEVQGRWDGRAILGGTQGELHTDEGTFQTMGMALLEGRFNGHFLAASDGDRLQMLLELEGDVTSTNLEPMSVGAAAGPWRLGATQLVLLFAAVVAAAGATAGTGVWLTRRRHAPHLSDEPEPAAHVFPFSVEDCVAAAADAADDEDWPRAAEWLQRVRRMAPHSARTCADLAHAYCQMGQLEEGLRLYAEASRLSSDGEADFNAAVLALESGRGHEEVEEWLGRALERTPSYVVDVETDPAFEALRGRGAFEKMVRRAWERADDVDASEGAPVRS